MHVATGVQRWIVVLTAVTIVLFGGVVTVGPGVRSDCAFSSGSAAMSRSMANRLGRAPPLRRWSATKRSAVPRSIRPAPGSSISFSPTSIQTPVPWRFVVDGLRAPEEWHCGEPRVRIALVREGQEPDSSDTTASQEGAQGRRGVESTCRRERGGRLAGGRRAGWWAMHRQLNTTATSELSNRRRSSGRALPARGPAVCSTPRNRRTGRARSRLPLY